MRYKVLGARDRAARLTTGAGRRHVRNALGAWRRCEGVRRSSTATLRPAAISWTRRTATNSASSNLLGEFIKATRDDLIVATKYTQSADPKGSLSVTGNSRKAMVRSVEQSLKRLATDRIDLYWVHMPDGVTPIEEIVRGLMTSCMPARFSMWGCLTFQPGVSQRRRCSQNCAA